jgi:hypothetical protein
MIPGRSNDDLLEFTETLASVDDIFKERACDFAQTETRGNFEEIGIDGCKIFERRA